MTKICFTFYELHTNALKQRLIFPTILPNNEKNTCFSLYKCDKFVYNKEDSMQNILCADWTQMSIAGGNVAVFIAKIFRQVYRCGNVAGQQLTLVSGKPADWNR